MKKNVEKIMGRFPKVFKSAQWKKVESTLHVEGAFIVGGAALVFSVLAFWLIGPIICDLVGYIPLWGTHQLLKNTSIKSPERIQSTSYWIIFFFFRIAEVLLRFVLKRIPLFYLMKAMFFVYCYHPKTQGATKIYDAVSPSILSLLQIESSEQRKLDRVLSQTVPIQAAEEVESTGIGKLEVVVVEAKDLTIMDKYTETSDPYCILKLQAADGKPQLSFKTHCKVRNVHPMWNEKIQMGSIESKEFFLVVTVMHKQNVGNDDFIGSVKIPMQNIIENTEAGTSQVSWYTLEDPESMNPNPNGVQGQIHLTLTFTAL